MPASSKNLAISDGSSALLWFLSASSNFAFMSLQEQSTKSYKAYTPSYRPPSEQLTYPVISLLQTNPSPLVDGNRNGLSLGQLVTHLDYSIHDRFVITYQNWLAILSPYTTVSIHYCMYLVFPQFNARELALVACFRSWSTTPAFVASNFIYMTLPFMQIFIFL